MTNKIDKLDIDFLPERVKIYVNWVHSVLKKELKDEYVSLIIFGSSLDDTRAIDAVADADLICICKDSISEEKRVKIREIVHNLEVMNAFSYNPKGIIQKVAWFMENTTGMFVSFFLSKKSSFLSADFHTIFDVSALAKVLAPSNLVFGSVISASKTIWGEDLLPLIKKPPPTIRQLLKSLIMDMLISLGANLVVYYFDSEKANKYLMECTKWSMLSSYYAINKTRPPLPVMARYFNKCKPSYSKYQFAFLKSLRNNLRGDPRFGIKTIFNVIKIHIIAIKHVVVKRWLINKRKKQLKNIN